MDAIGSPETYVLIKATRLHVPGENVLQFLGLLCSEQMQVIALSAFLDNSSEVPFSKLNFFAVLSNNIFRRMAQWALVKTDVLEDRVTIIKVEEILEEGTF